MVYRYTAGKKDWLANGLPVEGLEASSPRLSEVARADAPICSLGERVGEIRERVEKAGWDICVVLFESGVVAGLPTSEALEGDPWRTAEEAMDGRTRTYRLNASPEKVARYLQKKDAAHMILTTTDGRFRGVLERERIEQTAW